MILDKLYLGFVLIAIASAIIAIIRISLGHNIVDAATPNIVVGGVCLACIMILGYKMRRLIPN